MHNNPVEEGDGMKMKRDWDRQQLAGRHLPPTVYESRDGSSYVNKGIQCIYAGACKESSTVDLRARIAKSGSL